MERPIKLIAYRIGRDLHLDVDIVMQWPLSKLYEYMAFYITEQPEWRENYQEEKLTPEERTNRLLQVLRS